MDNTTFIDSEGHIIKKSSMVDEHQIIKITEKTPNVQNIGKIVYGDVNSNILTFEINRYYDGVDLYTKNIKFIVKNELGIFTEDAVNLQYNNELLRFSWVLSGSVTYKSGNVSVAIIFIGQNYALKTIPFTIKIDNSLDFLNIEPLYENWFVDIEARLFELENKTSNPNTSSSHSHNNKPILDKLSVSEDGNLLYDGNKITGSSDNPLSAYDIAVDHGFAGTEEEWLESLKGTPGEDGKSPTAEEVATELKSDTNFMESIKGEPGDSGDSIKITFSATEPTSVAEGEIIMVYEE